MKEDDFGGGGDGGGDVGNGGGGGDVGNGGGGGIHLKLLCRLLDVNFMFALAVFQILKENAPACLSLTHYTELMDSKGQMWRFSSLLVLLMGCFIQLVLGSNN